LASTKKSHPYSNEAFAELVKLDLYIFCKETEIPGGTIEIKGRCCAPEAAISPPLMEDTLE
jgi:hypothetical protein